MTPAPLNLPRYGATGFRLSEELIASLRQRIDSKYYDKPEVLEVIARAILCSHFVYL